MVAAGGAGETCRGRRRARRARACVCVCGDASCARMRLHRTIRDRAPPVVADRRPWDRPARAAGVASWRRCAGRGGGGGGAVGWRVRIRGARSVPRRRGRRSRPTPTPTPGHDDRSWRRPAWRRSERAGRDLWPTAPSADRGSRCTRRRTGGSAPLPRASSPRSKDGPVARRPPARPGPARPGLACPRCDRRCRATCARSPLRSPSPAPGRARR